MVDEEGVCEDGGLRRLGPRIRDKPGPDVFEQGRRCHEGVDQLWCEVGLHQRRLSRPFVNGLDGRASHSTEDGLGQETQFAREALRRGRVQHAGVQYFSDHGLELGDAPLGRLDRDPCLAEADAHSLDHLVPGRRLRFTRLSLQAEVAEQAAKGVEVGQAAELSTALKSST